MAGDRRSETVIHRGDRGPIREPNTVAHMVFPHRGQFGQGRLRAVFFHRQQIHVLDVGVVVGKNSVRSLEPLQVPLVTVREGLGTRLFDIVVLVRQTINVADALRQPRTVDFVLIFLNRNLFEWGILRRQNEYGRRGEKPQSHSRESFHVRHLPSEHSLNAVSRSERNPFAFSRVSR